MRARYYRARRPTRRGFEVLEDRSLLSIYPISVNPAGVTADGFSDTPAISGDGRYVAFRSAATDLVAGDTNNADDIFVRDLQTGLTVRASVDSGGLQSNGNSTSPSVSADGRYVAFSSQASNLATGDANGKSDVFVHDMLLGTTVRISVSSLNAEADNDSNAPSISATGRYVAFESTATNLVPLDTNNQSDVFVRDMQTGLTERVSISGTGVPGNLNSNDPSISSDGVLVAFSSSASNLVAGDMNSVRDVFVHDRVTGATVRVSVGSQGEGNGDSQTPAISGNGRYLTYQSSASNLIAGDTNGLPDIFVEDLFTGITQLVTRGLNNTPADHPSGNPDISFDGHYIVFESGAWNLISNGAGPFSIYRQDRQTGVITKLNTPANRHSPNENSGQPVVSDDGQVVAFSSLASNLTPNDFNGVRDVYVVQPTTGILATGADAGGGPHVRVFDGTSLAEISNFFAFDAAFTGGVRVAMGDVTGDAVPDLIAAAGPGGGPHVRVIDGTDFQLSSLRASFFAFDASYSGGLNVASADINRDGFDDIIVGADSGLAQVRVFSGRDGSVLYDFTAMPTSFQGGVRVAAGDVDGDGYAEIITGAGPGGASEVHIYSGADGSLMRQSVVYASDFHGGVYIASGDVNADGHADIVVGAGAGGGPHVRLFDGATGAELQSFFAFDAAFSGGVRVGLTQIGNVGEILAAAGPGGGPHVKAFLARDLTQVASFFAYGAGFTGGVFISGSVPPANPLFGHLRQAPLGMPGSSAPSAVSSEAAPRSASTATSVRQAALEQVLGAAGAADDPFFDDWLVDTLAHLPAPATGDDLALVL